MSVFKRRLSLNKCRGQLPGFWINVEAIIVYYLMYYRYTITSLLMENSKFPAILVIFIIFTKYIQFKACICIIQGSFCGSLQLFSSLGPNQLLLMHMTVFKKEFDVRKVLFFNMSPRCFHAFYQTRYINLHL